MSKFFILTFFTILIPFISIAQKETDNLNEKDITQIIELKNQFENALEKYYPNLNLIDAYGQYLSDLENRTINPNILREQKSQEILRFFL